MEKRQKDILQVKGENKNTGMASETILTFFLLFGFILSLKDLSYSVSCIISACIAGGVVILFFQAMEKYTGIPEKIHRFFYIFCVAFCLISGAFLIRAFLYIANVFIQLWNLRFKTEIVLLSTGSSVGFASMLLWIILGAVLGNLFLSQIKKRRLAFPIIMIIIAIAFSGILGVADIWPGMILLLASLLGVFIFYSVPGRKLGIYGVECIGAAVVFMAILTLISGGYKKSVRIERYKYNVTKAIEKFRYGEDTLPQGNFRKASGLLHGNEERLSIKTDTPQELYLKGFVGAEYTKNGWETLSSEKYSGKYDGMLSWLKKNDFLPVTQYSSYDSLSKKASGQEASYKNISVTNKNAYRKYVYLPSALSSWERAGTKINKDWNIYSTAFFGAKNYSFSMVDQALTAEAISADEWTQNPTDNSQESYLNTESIYHSFVEDTYLSVEDKEKNLIREVFFKNKKEEKEDFTDVTTQIRQILRSEMTYTKEPASLPKDTDFLSWFLKEEKSGNAVAFATAAVMAYRTAGYPARYVEGYHLSATKAENLSRQDVKNISLTTQDAHAWVEVYVTGIGWLPVEVVPGLYTETYSNETVEGKPAYKINPQSNDEGLDTNDNAKGSGSGSAAKETKQKKKQENIITILFAYLLFIWMLLTILYLLLELQRAIRIHLKEKQKEKAIAEKKEIAFYIKEMESLFIVAKIKGNYSHPLELWEQIGKNFPGVQKEEYEKVLKLIQKARFGGMTLKPYEMYTLKCFVEHLKEALYSKKNILGKIKLRYVNPDFLQP